MAKRTKYIYKTDEIPHLWAHQSVERASNPQRNLSFEGAVIKSYGYWPLAAHVMSGKKKAILLRSDRYSVTTSRQQYAVRSAIPRSALVFYVPDVSLQYETDYHHSQNLAYFVEQSKKALKRSERARINPDADLQEAFANKETAKQYAQFFGLASPAKLFAFLPTGKKLAEQEAKIAARMKRAILAGEVREEKARLARAERERIAALELPEKIVAWRNGEYVPSAYAFPVMLRISKDGQNVETSKGAIVPMSHAKRGLKFVRSVIASGTEYVRNGHTLHLGHFPIDRIEINGTLHAGCHVIPYAEIEALAPLLESSPVSEDTQEVQG